jgi:pimeloyl-ACP methyl ester carboxylesterase
MTATKVEPIEPLYSQALIDVGHGPTVLLLHGLFGKVSMWKDVIESLKKNFRVIIPRLPILDLPAEHINVKDLTLHLHNYIQWHHLHDVHLVGHDIGGKVALQYAAEHPGNVNRIVLLGLHFGSIESILNKLDHRVMLLWGLEDRITPPEVAFHFHDFLQNSEIRFVEKCGHLPMVEEPEKFVNHLVSFFG